MGGLAVELTLRVETGPHQGLTFSTSQAGSYQLGRSADAAIVLNEDKYVSRKHCLIEVTVQGVTIRDVGSSGGTFVNTRRVNEARLSDGDTILVGQTTIRVSIVGMTSAPPALEPLPRVAGFTLVKKLSAGAVGEVWWAVAEQAGRLVNLHFLPLNEPATAEDRQRFLRQAAICARLNHPGLVRFLAQDITPEMLWFATELTEGPNLRQYVSQVGGLSPQDALQILAQALEIMAYLHRENVVHRSLRPESLLVKKQDGVFLVQLADLGSAKCFQIAELQRITKLGERGYAIHAFTAPESLIDFAKMDPRSDVYALGAILYFCLSTCNPYDVPAEEGLIAAILEAEPVSLATLKPGLSPLILNLVAKAMSKEASKRYSNAQEMAGAVGEALGRLGFQPSSAAPNRDDMKAASKFPDERESLRNQLNRHKANLNILKEQAALYGLGDIPLRLVNQIALEEQAVEALEERLHQIAQS
jgi:serine/threonine-protein kinase